MREQVCTSEDERACRSYRLLWSVSLPTTNARVETSLYQRCDEANGIKVAVVGSGPSGLSFAGDMAKKGFDVTVFEASARDWRCIEIWYSRVPFA